MVVPRGPNLACQRRAYCKQGHTLSPTGLRQLALFSGVRRFNRSNWCLRMRNETAFTRNSNCSPGDGSSHQVETAGGCPESLRVAVYFALMIPDIPLSK